ncbi:ubiquitin-like domain-containing protein [Streptomyces sp. HNM0574]|uniref:ubiquitin-like domain-containing protein n=1 Tax=Streptomyces sp. HNM0574 TaxID=2714954 RepID=UPI0032170ACF
MTQHQGSPRGNRQHERPARETPPERRAERPGRRRLRVRRLDRDRRDTGGEPARPRSLRKPEAPAADALRRLLPRALVLAVLAGGTTAYVLHDKQVELSVDGAPRSLHTFADDVDGLLAEEGVETGHRDIVAPGREARLNGGDHIAVRHGRPLVLTLDGQRREVWTTAGTVDGALRQLGVRAQGAYLSVSRAAPIGREGLSLDVRTERTVTLVADGRSRTVRTNAATVRGALAEHGISLGAEDTVSARPDSFPRDGQTVTVTRVATEEKVREERIGFRHVRREDPDLARGTEVVARKGKPGLRRVTYRLRTVDGVAQEPRRTGSETVRRPRAEIVEVGTRPRPKPPSTPSPSASPHKPAKPKPSRTGSGSGPSKADGLNWRALAQCESGGRPNAVDPTGTYGGLYQFDLRTWRGLGGTGRPQDAPPAEQTARAKQLYAERGANPWPVCGRKLTR